MKRNKYSNRWACCEKTRVTAFCDTCGRPRPVPSACQEAVSLANDFDTYARGRMKAAEEIERQIEAERDTYPPHEQFNPSTMFEQRWNLKKRNADGLRQCAARYLEWARIIRDSITEAARSVADSVGVTSSDS